MRFRAFLGCYELLDVIQPGSRMLDIGGGDGFHAGFFRDNGLNVDIVDISEGIEPLCYEGEYEKFHPASKYDVIWCSHVYEHIMNPGQFISKIYEDLNPGGILAITVPPSRPSRMIFPHVTLWNAGLLLIHLIKSGFDCRNAHIASYKYNITVIAQKPNERLNFEYTALLPQDIKVEKGYFDGEIKFMNWKHRRLHSYIDPAFDMRGQSLSQVLRKLSQLHERLQPAFAVYTNQDTNKNQYVYVDRRKRIVVRVV